MTYVAGFNHRRFHGQITDDATIIRRGEQAYLGSVDDDVPNTAGPMTG